jgi:hypothetical protein
MPDGSHIEYIFLNKSEIYNIQQYLGYSFRKHYQCHLGGADIDFVKVNLS